MQQLYADKHSSEGQHEEPEEQADKFSNVSNEDMEEEHHHHESDQIVSQEIPV